MVSGVVSGNARADGERFNYWFIGDFKRWCLENAQDFDASEFGQRATPAVEVKWGIHAAGESRPEGWAPTGELVTLSILIRGEFSLQFRSPEDRFKIQEYHLTHEGDYAVWGTEVEHVWQSIRDSVVLTVRWPTF